MSKRFFGNHWYHANGKRFRRTTMSDIGIGCCEKCGKMFVPDYSSLGPMIDPRDFNRMSRICVDCLKEGN